MIEQISKIGFTSKPIEPLKPLDAHYVPVQPVAPVSAVSAGVKMQEPLKQDTFTPTSARVGYEAAVDNAKKIGMNTSLAVQEAAKGNPAAQKQLNLIA